MELSKPFHRKKIVVIFLACILIFSGLSARVVYLMVFRAAHYSELALDLHQRERKIKAKRGRILDRNGIVLADNQPVCTISVIHNQIRDPDAVIALLCSKLGLSEETVRKRVEKVSSIEKIKSNVDLETGEEIYRTGLDGIKVDEDYKRYYPYEDLASKVIGFTGGDNQGILALESRYEEVLSGQEGLILEMTDARGVRLLDEGESRVEPVDGKDLYISLDANIQLYAQQLAEQVCLEKEAESVSILVLRPDNGEILAMADVPEYQLNDPFTLPEGQQEQLMTEKEKQEALNKMWRNACINDTYEPGSAFKVITAAAALENGVVREEDSFQCPGYIVVEGRKIRCAKVRGHGTENFVQGTMNSCNPVFVTVGLRMGADTFYQSMKQFGLLNRTGIDVPGEAGTIMHAQDQIGPVELATISFGQSFQITPIQLAATVSSLINGGTRIIHRIWDCIAKRRTVRSAFRCRRKRSKNGFFRKKRAPGCAASCFRSWKTAAEKMEKSKAIRWAARRRPARRFLAVLVGIFLRFWVLHLRTIRRCWHCALSETPKASIMVDWWRHR